MKQSILVLLVFFCCLTTACKKTPPADKDELPDTISQEAGEPLDDTYFDFIGPEGGIIKSPDGILEIEIPPHALTEGTEIGITPISNTSPGANGIAYRITPHDVEFNQPVTLRFSYDGKIPKEVMAVASQDSNGVWKTVGEPLVDTSAKTVAVETTHFSDWSFIETLRLLPLVASVKPGGQVKLSAVRFTSNIDDEFLVPLDGTVLSNGKPLDPAYVKNWYVAGIGNGTIIPNGNEATYIAPSTEGEAYVTAELNVNGKKVLLIAMITIMDEGIRMRIDGGPWQKFQGIGTQLPDGFNSIANFVFNADQPQFKILWKGSTTIVYPWCDLATFQHVIHPLSNMYTSYYEDANNIMNFSRGRLRVKESQGDGKTYFLGTAYIRPSALISIATTEQLSTSEIEVMFRVQKQ